jgi:hypothetical protein
MRNASMQTATSIFDLAATLSRSIRIGPHLGGANYGAVSPADPRFSGARILFENFTFEILENHL